METAWETWKKAGQKLAHDELKKNKSIIELGEEAFRYAVSRGLGHYDIIVRAFREGFYEAYKHGLAD